MTANARPWAPKALSPEGDGIAQKASAARARSREGRKRVCFGCQRPEDDALGLVHSELPCERCGAVPCHGIVTNGALGPSGPKEAA